MSEFLPFSKRSQQWERTAIELRRIAGVSSELLCPWELAPKVGLQVVDAKEIFAELDARFCDYLEDIAGSKWSGGVLPMPLPSGHLVCIVNPFHHPNRQKITLMEEVAHIHCDHRPSQLLRHDASLSVRDYDSKQEAEAYGVGAAALLPWSTFFHALNSGMQVPDMAEKYAVSKELIEYRIKITGATSLFRSRQRKSSV